MKDYIFQKLDVVSFQQGKETMVTWWCSTEAVGWQLLKNPSSGVWLLPPWSDTSKNSSWSRLQQFWNQSASVWQWRAWRQRIRWRIPRSCCPSGWSWRPSEGQLRRPGKEAESGTRKNWPEQGRDEPWHVGKCLSGPSWHGRRCPDNPCYKDSLEAPKKTVKGSFIQPNFYQCIARTTWEKNKWNVTCGVQARSSHTLGTI